MWACQSLVLKYEQSEGISTKRKSSGTSVTRDPGWSVQFWSKYSPVITTDIIFTVGRTGVIIYFMLPIQQSFPSVVRFPEKSRAHLPPLILVCVFVLFCVLFIFLCWLYNWHLCCWASTWMNTYRIIIIIVYC